MSGGAKTKQQQAQGASAPASTHVPSKASAPKKAEPAKAGVKTRKLPIRSSPVSTAPSLRTTLATLKTKAPRAPAAAKANLPPFARKPVLQELEPRLLLSAPPNPRAPPPPSPRKRVWRGLAPPPPSRSPSAAPSAASESVGRWLWTTEFRALTD